jgi:hypothetical protein
MTALGAFTASFIAKSQMQKPRGEFPKHLANVSVSSEVEYRIYLR